MGHYISLKKLDFQRRGISYAMGMGLSNMLMMDLIILLLPFP
uniref:Uncharacterized protein n=1 Tax=Rhizophora mucronata TaxID=61149 RepID=A0A2P2Q5F8_RHIMU